MWLVTLKECNKRNELILLILGWPNNFFIWNLIDEVSAIKMNIILESVEKLAFSKNEKYKS